MIFVELALVALIVLCLGLTVVAAVAWVRHDRRRRRRVRERPGTLDLTALRRNAPWDPGRLRVAADALKPLLDEEQWSDNERDEYAALAVAAYHADGECPTCRRRLAHLDGPARALADAIRLHFRGGSAEADEQMDAALRSYERLGS